MDKKIIKALQKALGKKQVLTSQEELLCYSYDGSGGNYSPEAVVFPSSTEEVARIMELASFFVFPVIPRGAGSGMTGGALAVSGGVVLALSRLNRILEIDEENQIAVVEPGVITGDFQEEVRARGLYYPPDPASLKFCTMGGNVAECAGGPSALKYGVTREYILGLEVVLPDGRVMETGVRTAKGVVGYDFTRLFTGSEGTLGIITKIIVRLIANPKSRGTFLALFTSMDKATSLIAGLLKKITPAALEFLDRTALEIVKDKLPFALPEKTGSLLLLEVDGDSAMVEHQAAVMRKTLATGEGLLEVKEAKNEEEAAELWSARKALSPSSFILKPDKMSEDVVVPRTKIADLIRSAKKLSRKYGIIIFTFGHAGDGNIHINIMLDKKNENEYCQALDAKEKLFSEVLRLGGTLSGEHGVGITKMAFLDREISGVGIDMMKKVKSVFDPLNILNPGKIFMIDS